MNNRQGISKLLGIAAAVVLAANVHAADINVPGDQPTIQAGINAAVNGDVVIVAQGEYLENINFNGNLPVAVLRQWSTPFRSPMYSRLPATAGDE